jgi:hypothetical protein
VPDGAKNGVRKNGQNERDLQIGMGLMCIKRSVQLLYRYAEKYFTISNVKNKHFIYNSIVFIGIDVDRTPVLLDYRMIPTFPLINC